MHDIDFDLSDSARALIRNGINIDDRTAVESALSDTAGYTHDPALFTRYVDEVINDGAPQYGDGPNRLDRTTTTGAGATLPHPGRRAVARRGGKVVSYPQKRRRPVR